MMVAVGSPNLGAAVEKAQERAEKLGADLGDLTRSVRDSSPASLNTQAEQRARHDFLESMYDEQRQADVAFERIIAGNELQEANFLPRGALVAGAVLRIAVRNSGGRVLGYGSGFLVGDGVLITNNHVLPNSDIAAESLAEAFFELGLDGEQSVVQRFAFEPSRLFHTSKPLDFTLVAVAPQSRDGAPLAAIGWLPLLGTSGKAMEGEWLTIIQHPRGERKQLCIRENQLLKRDDDVLWYSTDTLGGSSGSPVFNNDWLIVALHHSGVPETRDGKWQTIDGRDFDPARDDETKIKWVANEGIRVSRIVETLRTDNRIATHPMVAQLLDVGTQDISARSPLLHKPGSGPAGPGGAGVDQPHAPASAARAKDSDQQEVKMGPRTITVTLTVDDDGGVSLLDRGTAEFDLLEGTARPKPKKNIIEAPVNPEVDWVDGYDSKFLIGKNEKNPELEVHLPTVVQTEKVAPLRNAYGQSFSDAEKAAGVLKYKGYSVVMNKDRRFAIYSAANVDGGMRPMISGRKDDWLFDDRILREHQVDNSFYRKNKFDRGHLTRRDDMEWGTDPVDAVNRANGTCTWPNCAAQHEVFNQSKDKGVLLWQNLERYILEETAAFNRFRVQVITGMIFGVADPVFRGIAYPLDYWKVVAAVDGKGKLFATAYILGQKATIDKFGIEEAAIEQPFGEFGTYQRPIGLIEDLTGLNFTFGAKREPLSKVDPLTKPRWRKRRASTTRLQESFGATGDDALGSLDDIILE